ncbi:MAG: response regulator [Myxococcaceae bacterium]|nr:response regulator [Myxococcaceae bacterium]
MKVMIVDDETDIRESLREVFEDEGYEVATAANGAEALSLLAKNDPPCAMVLDLIMPEVGGVEVYQKMQTDPRLSRVPVIISTSDPSRAPSGVLIMKKPIDLNRLLETVHRYCRS